VPARHEQQTLGQQACHPEKNSFKSTSCIYRYNVSGYFFSGSVSDFVGMSPALLAKIKIVKIELPSHLALSGEEC
jgi:hypothetical protein